MFSLLEINEMANNYITNISLIYKDDTITKNKIFDILYNNKHINIYNMCLASYLFPYFERKRKELFAISCK